MTTLNHNAREMPPKHPHFQRMAIEDALAITPIGAAPTLVVNALIAAYGEEQARAIVGVMQ